MSNSNLFQQKLPLAASLSVHVCTILVLLLYGFSHLLYDSLLISFSCFVALIFAICSLFATINKSDTGIFLLGFLISLAVTVTITSYLYGARGLIYCFSLSAVLFFMMAYPAALVGGLLICVINLVAATHSMELLMVMRFTVAIALSFAFSAVFAHQIFKQQARLEKEANEDYLTGLMNQRSFYHWLGEHLSNSNSFHTKLTLYYFDIDDFKSVNDSFGHEGGDRVLKEFAERIKTCVGQLNLEFCVDTNMYFCRLAGDEFVLACPNTDSRATATEVANSFQEVLSKPFSIGERLVQIRSSMGIHHFQIENQDIGYVMRSADTAMYEAKKGGKQQFYISEDSAESRIYRDMPL